MVISVTDCSRPVYLFMGGTFDPIHNGHLCMAIEAKELLGVDKVHLMPTPQPVHKTLQGVDTEHRLAMLDTLVSADSALAIDTREIQSKQAAYTVSSLEAMRADLGGDAAICMLIGMDSLHSLDTWYRYEKLLSLCHIIAVGRPGNQQIPNLNVQHVLAQHQIEDATLLTQQAAGALYLLKAPLLEVSSTDIRQRIAQGRSVRYLLPEGVQAYIKKHSLYIN